MENMVNFQKGCITFLDVLGWRGIYNQKTTAIEELEEITKIDEIVEDKKYIDRTEILKKKVVMESNQQQKEIIDVKLEIISDTIVIISETCADCSKNEDKDKDKIFSPIEVSEHLEIHGKITQKIMENSSKKGLFLRGATSFGNYRSSDNNNIFIGNAIDEVADWYENTEWVGCVLTPTTEIYFDELRTLKNNNLKAKDHIERCEKYWCEYQHNGDKIPVKSGANLRYALKWKLYGGQLEKIKLLASVSPLTNAIANKYLNTFKYMSYLDKQSKGMSDNKQLLTN